MAYVLLNNQIFSVDEGYLDEPLDSIYPLFNLAGEQVGCMEARTLQLMGFKIPACYQELFQKRVYAKALQEYLSIEIVPVLKLVVNNERYINYLIKPMVLDTDIAGREGGQYYGFKMIGDELVLIGGKTGTQFLLNYKHNIPACADKTLLVLKDKYFFEAIAKLKEMYEAQNVCAATIYYQAQKDPITVIPDCGEQEKNHHSHCEWCLELGLDGMHKWNNDGTVYGGDHTTTSSPWGRLECTSKKPPKPCC